MHVNAPRWPVIGLLLAASMFLSAQAGRGPAPLSTTPETHTGFSRFMMFTSGNTHRIVLGQMYRVPINTPHWVVPDAGGSVTYWVTNINVDKP